MKCGFRTMFLSMQEMFYQLTITAFPRSSSVPVKGGRSASRASCVDSAGQLSLIPKGVSRRCTLLLSIPSGRKTKSAPSLG